VILIATSSTESLARWTLGVTGLGAVLAVGKLDALQQALIRIAPAVLLLDMDLPGVSCATVASLRKRNPATKIVALNRTVSDEAELMLFKSGVRACCRRDIDPPLLARVVGAIEQGELWIRRSLTPRLLDELGEKLRHENRVAAASTVGRLAELTLREREIAALIGNGDSNKQIARQLAITERTVKAHLTGIFRKLGIADRLGLALRVTATVEVKREHMQ
jgi:DNA-binding NarL/FixJ family response regulator